MSKLAVAKLICLFCLLVASPSLQQQQQAQSPCPNVFNYEPPGSEPGRWYGVVNLSTDSTLHSLWLNIVLDSKADILGNWVGDVTTLDNIDFKIENTKMKIHPGPAEAVRFFVQYNPLNKAPKLKAIRLNGREICNANNPLPVVDRPEESRPIRTDVVTARPIRTEAVTTRPIRPQEQQSAIRPEDRPQTRPVQGRPTGDGPVYTPTVNPPIEQSNPSVYSIGEVPSKAQTVGTQTRPGNGDPYRFTTAPPTRTTTRRQVYVDDFNDDDRGDPADYFAGGQPTFIVSPKPQGNKNQNNFDTNPYNRVERSVCGTVVKNNPNPLVVNGRQTLEGQWPWQIALYQTRSVDNKYICGGTLVTHLHIITAAHCVTRKRSNRIVNPSTLTIFMGKHNLRTSSDGVQFHLVTDVLVHPEYNATSYSRDLAILTIRQPADYTDWVRPACLWPDSETDISNVIGKKGSVVGWGFDDKGMATEELTLVEMPVVNGETCVRSYSEFFGRFTSNYTYCAGYRDEHPNRETGILERTSVCNGDSGGGMVFYMRNAWYLRGLVSLSVARHNEYRCDPSHYVVFTDLAQFLPWIKENIHTY